MSDVRSQFRLLASCVSAVGSSPMVVLYPAALSTGILASTAAFVAYVIFGWPPLLPVGKWLRWLAVAAYFVVVAVLISFFSVAFAHEMDAIYGGEPAAPGSGLRVAIERLPLVLAAALALGPGSMLLSRLQGFGPIGTILGRSAMAASGVAQVFAFPVVATTGGSASEAFDDLVDALEHGWGAAAVSSVSTRALMTAIGWAGIVTGLPMLFAAFGGITIVSLPPFGRFTVPLLLPVASTWLAFAVTAFVRGVVNTALYRYVTTGEYPDQLQPAPRDLLGEDREPAGAGGPAPAE